jgi:hypothetical protein
MVVQRCLLLFSHVVLHHKEYVCIPNTSPSTDHSVMPHAGSLLARLQHHNCAPPSPLHPPVVCDRHKSGLQHNGLPRPTQTTPPPPPVVCDRHHCALEVSQEALQPRNTLSIKVVGRLHMTHSSSSSSSSKTAWSAAEG